MIIRPVAEVLANNGLAPPTLESLIPDASNYSVMMFQPKGTISATRAGIRHKNPALATKQFSGFLDEVCVRQPALAVTPEYSLPWETLLTTLGNAGNRPDLGKLWVLGCESITLNELSSIKQRLGNDQTLIYEDVQPAQGQFVDSLVYVFQTARLNENRRQLVMLVQFKTHAMADKQEFEKQLLQLGTTIYRFGEVGTGISLVSLICSDVMAFDDATADTIRDRAIILHLQMNSEPRHQNFLEARARLLGYGNETEILVLNWGYGTTVCANDHELPVKFGAGSAWYAKAPELDKSDETLATNHRNGMYYTWLQPHRTHALFFNINQVVFEIQTSKVFRRNVRAAAAQRRGPQVTEVMTWDEATASWKHNANVDDGFAELLKTCSEVSAEIKAVFDVCPVACERLLALCAGCTGNSLDWFNIHALDSFHLDTTELVHRLTFCQETNDSVKIFRNRRLRRCASLWHILKNIPAMLPPSFIKGGQQIKLDWKPQHPHQNLILENGEFATAIYLGEEAGATEVEAAYKIARERVRRSLGEQEAESAKYRVAVWYRNASGDLSLRWDPPSIDREIGQSEYDIARAS